VILRDAYYCQDPRDNSEGEKTLPPPGHVYGVDVGAFLLLAEVAPCLDPAVFGCWVGVEPLESDEKQQNYGVGKSPEKRPS